MRKLISKKAISCLALSLALMPAAAYADTGSSEPAEDAAQKAAMTEIVNQNGSGVQLLAQASAFSASQAASESDGAETSVADGATRVRAVSSPEKSAKKASNNKKKQAKKAEKKKTSSKKQQKASEKAKSAKKAKSEKSDAVKKVLKYDRALIEQIGTQEQTGHTICCPSFSCAYADAVMDGTVHDHDYYTCSCCTWTDWGGGGSSNRCVGTDEELLREAYDQIKAGKPTVIHVAASYGEHWIALIGYKNATDPDHLTLSNFIALDPWDGSQITAGDSFTLFGDGCEHISDR